MKIDRVKDFAAVGKVHGATAFHARPLHGDGWLLTFDLDPDVPTGGSPDLYTKRGELRVFRTLDAVADVVNDIGLAVFRVEIQDAL